MPKRTLQKRAARKATAESKKKKTKLEEVYEVGTASSDDECSSPHEWSVNEDDDDDDDDDDVQEEDDDAQEEEDDDDSEDSESHGRAYEDDEDDEEEDVPPDVECMGCRGVIDAEGQDDAEYEPRAVVSYAAHELFAPGDLEKKGGIYGPLCPSCAAEAGEAQGACRGCGAEMYGPSVLDYCRICKNERDLWALLDEEGRERVREMVDENLFEFIEEGDDRWPEYAFWVGDRTEEGEPPAAALRELARAIGVEKK